MRTDATARLCRVALVAAAAALGDPAPAAAQAVDGNAGTQIRSVHIQVPGHLGLRRGDLMAVIATRGRGRLPGVRRALRWVPFVPAATARPLDLLELQRDRERLRRFLVRRGYPGAGVEYDLRPTGEAGTADVVFRIRPGPPLVLRKVALAWVGPAEGRPPEFDEPPAPDRLLAESGGTPPLRVGAPLDSAALEPAAIAVARWLGDRGHAFATVDADVVLDSASGGADVVLLAAPGPPTRIGSIAISGAESLRETTLRAFAGVRPGDRFSLADLEAASERISALDLVRRATFRIPPHQPVDTAVDVELRVVEEPLREITGELGYASDGGIAGEAAWTHRSVFGGAQTLSATVAGQTGTFALEDDPEKFVRGTLSLRQPIAGRAWLTLDLAPFAAYRNDFRDRSAEYGIAATLLQRLGPLSSVALRYELSTRRIYEYRFGDFSGGADLLELLQLGAEGVLDSLGVRIGRSLLSLSGSFGALDVPTDPRRGLVVQPSVTVTAPAALTATQYATANLCASGYLPVTSRLTLATRVGAGRLVPFGKSVPPSPADGLTAYFRLRDALFTAGGMDDVRGWADGLLGPKFPRIVLSVRDSTLAVTADRYVPIGGFNRVHGSLEARLALPGLGDAWAVHAFLDAGRVWTRDARFTSSEDPNGVEKLFWAAGGGIDYATPVGAVRVAVGYKLNPSFLDLVLPDDFARAVLYGTSWDDLPRHPWRRVQIHIGLGTRL